MTAAQSQAQPTFGTAEQRRSERVPIGVPVRLWHADGDPLPDMARTQDISASGVRIVTECAVAPGEEVSVSIPTRGCPPELGLPALIEGKAVARRVSAGEGNRQVVALAFHEALAQSMEMALYMAYLLGGGDRMSQEASPRFA